MLQPKKSSDSSEVAEERDTWHVSALKPKSVVAEAPQQPRPRLLMRRRDSRSNVFSGEADEEDNISLNNSEDGRSGSCMTLQGKPKVCCNRLRRLVWKHPLVSRIRRRYRKIPARYKYMCFILWVSWKFVAAFLVVYLLESSSGTSQESAALMANPLRILYIVTSSAAYNAIQSSSWKDSIINFAEKENYKLSVVLILGDEIDDTQEATITKDIPGAVDIFIWSDAVPFTEQDGKLIENHDALQLQYRFVIKDHWFGHDVFMVWDEASRLYPEHVDYFWKQSLMLSATYADAERIVIPGFVSVAFGTNQTQVSGMGPFDRNKCCGDNTLGTLTTVGDQTSLSPIRVQRLSDDSKVAVLPSYRQTGWMLTREQIWKLFGKCSSFFPLADNQPEECVWHRWISLADDAFSHHFVLQTPAKGVLSPSSPNHLWKIWGDKTV